MEWHSPKYVITSMRKSLANEDSMSIFDNKVNNIRVVELKKKVIKINIGKKTTILATSKVVLIKKSVKRYLDRQKSSEKNIFLKNCCLNFL
uniref:60S ribosomal protein L28 n=1 Tax=Strongyloides venezuelensis TaxID=75913 RepID=A0A0K0F4B0_STRVS